MLGRVYRRARWYMLPLIILAIGIAITSSSVFAGIPLTHSTGSGAGVSQKAASGPASDFAAARSAVAPPNSDSRHRTLPPRTMDAFLTLVPEAGGPPNGGNVNVGDRFVLDLILNAGTNPPPNGATAQQSYMTY